MMTYPGTLMPATIPMDPADIEKLPPDDLDTCVACGGTGVAWTDSFDPQELEACLVCKGEGVIV